MQPPHKLSSSSSSSSIPHRYLPSQLTRKDRTRQRKGILQSRRAYLQGRYVGRPHVNSFRSHPSPHIANAPRKNGVQSITASAELARKTRCKRSALAAILRKGRGAYYSSGSRPNQTAESWARARLASALTHGKAARVDHAILKNGCAANSPAL